jgi:Flp pilus assembly protein TadB
MNAELEEILREFNRKLGISQSDLNGFTVAGGIRVSLCGVLLVVFVVLKLVGVVDWSWLWVLSPLWIPILLALLIFILISIFK